MKSFPEQVSTEVLLLAFLYTLAAFAVIVVILGLGLIDMGLVRRRNVLDTWVQKITAAMIGGVGTLLGGYAIWQWSFNQAFGVPDPLRTAVKDWWIAGSLASTPAVHIDPKIAPEADVLQVFLVFFVTFSMAAMALIHTGVVERAKARPLYIMSFVVGAVLSPLVGYLCWGSVSPLTNRGVHDFDGVFPLYVFAGTWVLVMAWRIGPRLGAFTPHASGAKPVPHNVGFVAAGVLLITFAAPFVALGSGYAVPGKGFFGISYTESGFGLVVTNVIAGLIGGGLMGAAIAYKRREPSWTFLGPIAGMVINGTLFDVGTPLKCLLVGLLGPLVGLGTTAVLRRLRIDEPKVLPLAFGPGIVGAILTGFIAWGTPTGGFPGLEGEYALGHAVITPWWQLVGVLAAMATAGIPCLIMCLVFERFGGLRVSEETEVIGLDAAHWGTTNFGDDLDPPAIPVPGEGAAVHVAPQPVGSAG
ncbi:ammonium transporter [Planosporangium mesophilum]|uniref:Ammonium transporter n=1 Tax=Planosporangium mesophilum TaxID=689768 RepID=A0A8J3TE02_9ACTN|nr:ammonium transporter [Planosporangium mesophilum]NJC84430.1 ammonium transporter [Planosporangium mesophilum]GII23427.1 ammonium transporter [Planosporangium mesophilum]